MIDLLGMRVAVNDAITYGTVPARKHTKRKGTAYHRRIQKKWTKRFGTRVVEFAFVLNPSMLGLPNAPHVVMSSRAFAMARNLR